MSSALALRPSGIIFWRPLLVTLLLHGLLLYSLTLDWGSSETLTVTPKPTPRYIEARLVEIERAKPKPKKAATRPKPATRTATKPRPKPAVKTPAKTAPKPSTKPAEKPKVEPKTVEPPRPTAEERAAQSRAELALAMAEEDEMLEQASDAQLIASYTSLIAGIIEDNWSRPPSARNEMEAELIIQLIPTGEVVSVTVARSSGLPAFDRSAIMAVQKAERFPELQELEPRLFERNFRRLRLKFKPEDLRF